MKELSKIIGEHRFFRDLSEEYLNLIAGCGEMAVFNKNEYLFKYGQPAEYFYLVRFGKVVLELNIPGREAFLFQTLQNDAIVGWSWLFDPYVYQFDVRAMEQTRVVRFDGVCLRGKCDQDVELGYTIMKRFSKVMVRRLAETRLQLIDVYGTRQD